eukprot:CAMPEP_0168608684 /NCGR_PEP_ID=MMETSP0449_2-20121227/773_1 /TAXON_ID=1082188 /ORGANISM="Strombidium rassoulzadegani, Strain ras09" /LENGTH=151 /DNA_ID=CAMNT_0008648715 /DNA_START=514 /DNA_END=969 /DNA_ORIENTATION=-
MLRDIFFCPAFFGQYMIWKRYFHENGTMEVGPEGTAANRRVKQHSITFMAGAVSLFSAWVICYPIDLIKTQIQAVNLLDESQSKASSLTKSVSHQAKLRYRAMGLRGFYRGLGITLFRTVPTGGMSFLMYEVMKENLEASSSIIGLKELMS